METLIGMGIAIAGSSLFGVGAALQALEAREAPSSLALRASLLRRLLVRRRWLLGSALAGLSWPVHAAAMGFAPLAVVQAADSVGLVVLLAIAARMLGEPVGRWEWSGVLGIVAGVAVLVLIAPERSAEHASPRELALPLGIVGAGALAPYVLRGRLSAPGSVVALGAGLAFAWTAFATKLITDLVSSGTLSALVLWILGAGAFALLGVLSEASALQKRPATQVVPSIYVVELVVPVLLAVLVAGERPGSPAAAAGLVGCLALLAASVVVLARSRSLAGLVGR